VALAIYKEKGLSNQITISQLIDLAKVADPEPIDFGMIEIDEEEVFERIALAAVESLKKAEPATKDIVYLASIINLHVKNYILNMEKYELLSTIHRLNAKLEKNKG
jgi:hypothetical protein